MQQCHLGLIERHKRLFAVTNQLNVTWKGNRDIFTCVADDEICLSDVICYWVFEPKHLQTDVWTILGSWKIRSSSNLKNQTLISTSPQSLE